MARITKLRVAGYRSIGKLIEISFPKHVPVVLVGENNAGKSNVVRALQLVLGPFWPGNYDPDDHEFFGHQRNGLIKIEVEFDTNDPLGGRLGTLVWCYDPARDAPVFFRGYDCQSGVEAYVRNDERDTCACILVEADRNLSHQLGYSSKGTFLSRLMRRFHRALVGNDAVKGELEALFQATKEKFQQVPEFAAFVADLKAQFAELVGSMTHRLEVDFEAYNPVNFFHALRLQAVEGKEPRTFEEMGTGEQQVLALAFAHAYARAFHRGTVLIVEEPEAHLHPLAQQWLARRLQAQTADGLQLMITTHSPAFIHVESLEGLVRVHKAGGETRVTQLTRANLVARCVETGAPVPQVTETNILPFYAASASTDLMAGFFARAVVLVEGPTEALALPVYLRKSGFDVEREGVAFLSVGGKGNLAKWRRLYEAYGIPCYTIFDGDARDDNDGTKRRDALRSAGVPDDCHDGIIAAADWLVEDEYSVLGGEFEQTLAGSFGGYRNLEREARRQGMDSKPFVARWVAEHLEMNAADKGWTKMAHLAEALRRKLGVGIAVPMSTEGMT